MSAPRTTEAERQKILTTWRERQAAGEAQTVKAFANEFGVKPTTFGSWLSRAGYTTPRPADENRQSRTGDELSLADADRGGLVRFAASTLLSDQFVKVSAVAEAANTTTRELRRRLRWKRGEGGGPDPGPDPDLVRLIQRAIHTLSDKFTDPPPYPMELYEELLGVADDHNTRIPASWLSDLAATPPVRTTDVFARGEALYSTVSAIADTDVLQATLRRFSHEVTSTIEYLYAVAVQPPRIGTRAIHLLSRFGRLALDPEGGDGDQYIHNVIYASPLGYRAVRIVGRMITLERRRSSGMHARVDSLHDEIIPAIHGLLTRLVKSPPLELHPERSLIVESLWKATDRDAPGGEDEDWRAFAIEALRSRALGEHEGSRPGEPGDRPFRERAFAAVALYERAPELVPAILVGLRTSRVGDDDRDATKYLVATLEAMLEIGERRPAGYVVPESTDVVRDVTEIVRGHLAGTHNGVPRQSVGGAERLLLCALLDLHGTRRRRALETLRHSGLGALTATIASTVASSEQLPRWVRGQACFAIGFAQEHQFVGVLNRVVATSADSALRTVALHAIGDIGLNPNKEPGLEVLDALCYLDPSSRGVRETQALAYALSTVRGSQLILASHARPRLEEFSINDDVLTSRMAQWGLDRIEHRNRPIGHAFVPLAIPPTADRQGR